MRSNNKKEVLKSQVQERTSELEAANERLARLATTDTVTGSA